MLDTGPSQLQRSRGDASVRLAVSRGATRLTGLRQAGCAKAMLPRTDAADPEVVFLNTAGGLTGGDRLDYALDLAEGARATGATQTAERAYASLPGDPAQVRVTLRLGAGASLRWLPQETILFDRAALDRTTDVHLGEGARILMAETVVLGRAAMRETVQDLRLTDRRRIFGADGVPILIEPLRIDTAVLTDRAARAGLAGHAAFATVILVGPDAEAQLGPVRRLLDGSPDAAASAWDGKLIVRARATDGFPLRKRVARIIETLSGAPLPRVWQI